MPPSASIEKILMEASSLTSSPSPSPSPSSTTEETFVTDGRRFSDLRGVRWRMDLGILTCSLSASIDDLRRTTAESRRRYAALRRKLLVDPHIPKDGTNSPEPVIDNPLSQSPDSMWGRFFRNAELERMLDQDLTRLYPEQANYFQTAGCQSMLRRILLLWCLRHPECGYRQGMHELLAPLLYVLQADLENLSQARKLYEDHFVDKFDTDSMYNFDFKKFPDYMEEDEDIGSKKTSKKKVCSLDELDPKIKEIVLLSDAYGAEGELGVVLSEKFLEHDAYCMFDASMNGSSGGAVAMVDFFLPFPLPNSQTGLSPAIEVSSAWYHLLSIVDSSLYSHLVELGVEPQYFALRWLRVLFGREFSLENLLIIWDNIFACDNRKTRSSDNNSLNSTRGAFISSLAVSMMLYLRSSLLATENPTSCLKRLLNFPNDVCLAKLLGKAKSLLVLALDPNNLTPLQAYSEMAFEYSKSSRSAAVRGHSLSSDSVSPMSPLSLVPDSYWEEKWRILHKEEEEKKQVPNQIPNRKAGWSEKVKMRLSRTGSVPSSPKVVVYKPSIRRNLLKDLEKELESDENSEVVVSSVSEKCPAVTYNGESEDRHLEEDGNVVCEGSSLSNDDQNELNVPNASKMDDESNEEGLSLEAHMDDGVTETSSVLSGPKEEEVLSLTPTQMDDDGVTETSLVLSGPKEEEVLSLTPVRMDDDGVSETSSVLSLPKEEEVLSLTPVQMDDDKAVTESRPISSGPKEQKVLLSKFPWLWKFGRRVEGGSHEKAANDQKIHNNALSSHPLDVSDDTSSSAATATSKVGESVDQNIVSTLRNIGGSMLENIQVIESSIIIEEDWGQQQGGGSSSSSSLESFSKNILAGKGQVAAVAALKELRKISNLLLEM